LTDGGGCGGQVRAEAAGGLSERSRGWTTDVTRLLLLLLLVYRSLSPVSVSLDALRNWSIMSTRVDRQR